MRKIKILNCYILVVLIAASSFISLGVNYGSYGYGTIKQWGLVGQKQKETAWWFRI